MPCSLAHAGGEEDGVGEEAFEAGPEQAEEGVIGEEDDVAAAEVFIDQVSRSLNAFLVFFPHEAADARAFFGVDGDVGAIHRRGEHQAGVVQNKGLVAVAIG